jgi:hypothetical protein
MNILRLLNMESINQNRVFDFFSRGVLLRDFCILLMLHKYNFKIYLKLFKNKTLSRCIAQ